MDVYNVIAVLLSIVVEGIEVAPNVPSLPFVNVEASGEDVSHCVWNHFKVGEIRSTEKVVVSLLSSAIVIV